MEFRILGPLEVRSPAGPVALGGHKPRAVMAMLLLHRDEPVNVERLAVAVWGSDAPATIAPTLHVHVSRLRKALGDANVLETTAAGYQLHVGADELDADRFERLVGAGEAALATGRTEEASTILREALDLWRGSPLADLEYLTFAQVEIARLCELRLSAIETRIEADLALGRHWSLIGELQQLVATHLMRERFAGQLMLALYRCGRQTEALDAYQRHRRHLADEVGLEPTAHLQALQAQILRQAPSLDAAAPPSVPQAVALGLPAPLVVAPASAFVGRERELKLLNERWEIASTRTREAVLVAGEAGIGKTRLAAELAAKARDDGALVLYGRCDEGLAVPYQPFVQALRPYAKALGADRVKIAVGPRASELTRLLPELGVLGEPAPADPESARWALFEAVAALLESATREQPALLVLDDLHWAAGPTLLLLRHLMRSDRALSALVIGTYRDTEVDVGEPLSQLLADLHRDENAHKLSVRGLDDDAIAALLSAEGGEQLHARSVDLVDILRVQTAGNPFFMRELIAHLTESNEIPPDGADPATAELDLPDGLKQLILSRVARLSDAAQQMLRLGAVVGPTFSFELLERASPEDAHVLDGLEEAAAAGLLSEPADGEYGFAHALVRQTLYRKLSSARRMRLHRRIGEALETFPDAEAHAEALAHHFAESMQDGQALKAADYALAAGAGAMARLGYEEAAAHYERGLAALARLLEGDRRCELLLALGDARWSVGERDGARKACREAAELAEASGDATRLARAAIGYAGLQLYESTAVTQEVVAHLSTALAALPDGDSALRAKVMGRLAAGRAYGPVEERSPALARAALEMARRVGDAAALAYVLAMAHWAVRGPDNLKECVAWSHELARLAASVGDGQLRGLAHEWMLNHLLEQGRLEEMEHEREAAERLSEGLREPKSRWLLAAARAGQALLEGQLGDAEELAHDALSRGLAEGADEPAIQTFGAQIASVRREQRRLGEIVEAVEQFTAQNPAIATWRCGLAYVYAELGRTEDARRELETLAREDFADLPRDAVWMLGIVNLAQVVASLGDRPRAELLYRLLEPFGDRCVVNLNVLCWGSASRTLGVLATVLERWDEAEAHFEAALAANARIRGTLWIAHTRCDYADTLLRRGLPGDRERALELLAGALAFAEPLALEAVAEAARRLRARPFAHQPL